MPSNGRLIVLLAVLVLAPSTAGAQLTKGLGDQPIPNPPGTDVSATVDGQTQNQPVGPAEVEIAVELGGSDEAQIGKTYDLVVAVHNYAPSTASNVRVPITLAVATGEGAVTPARSGVRYVSADSVECPLRGAARVCPFGGIPSGESRTVTVRVEVGAAARPGRMTFSAAVETDSRVAPGSRPREQKAVALVLNPRRQLDADIQVSMKPEAAVVGPGERFAYVLQVRNASERNDATDVELRVRHRLGVREARKFARLGGSARSVVSGEPAPECADAVDDVRRCRLGTLRSGEVRRVMVEMAIVQELDPGRWGRIDVEARVASAENDPVGANNLARAFTNVVSRLPSIRLVTPARNERGAEVTVPVDALAPGQVFGIEMRFMRLDVEPTGVPSSVRVSVDGGEARQVGLAQSGEFGSDRIFRSPFLRVVPPGRELPAGTDNARVIRAAPGNTVRVLFERPPIPGGGPGRAEIAVTVSAR